MKKIIKILRVWDKGKYKLTDALMEDGEEAQAYTPLGDKFEVGEEVEVFFDDRWNKIKFRRKSNSNNP